MSTRKCLETVAVTNDCYGGRIWYNHYVVDIPECGCVRTIYGHTENNQEKDPDTLFVCMECGRTVYQAPVPDYTAKCTACKKSDD